EAGVTIASDDNFRIRPNLCAKAREQLSIALSSAAGEKNSGAPDLLRQFAKDRAQFIRFREPKIRRRQFPLIQNAQVVRTALSQDPRGLGPAAFHAEDFFAAVHCRSLPSLYHALWPKTRLKRRSEWPSCGGRLASMTAAITRKPRRQSATANTTGFIKSLSILRASFPSWSRPIRQLSASAANRFKLLHRFSTACRC